MRPSFFFPGFVSRFGVVLLGHHLWTRSIIGCGCSITWHDMGRFCRLVQRALHSTALPRSCYR